MTRIPAERLMGIPYPRLQTASAPPSQPASPAHWVIPVLLGVIILSSIAIAVAIQKKSFIHNLNGHEKSNTPKSKR
jgi:hypothetical protein